MTRFFSPPALALGAALMLTAGYIGRGVCMVPFNPLEMAGVF